MPHENRGATWFQGKPDLYMKWANVERRAVKHNITVEEELLWDLKYNTFFNEFPYGSSVPALDEEAIWGQVNTRSSQLGSAPKSVLLPVFGNGIGNDDARDINYSALCKKPINFQEAIGLTSPPGNHQRDHYLIGHPKDVHDGLTKGNRGVIPWGMELSKETIVSEKLWQALTDITAQNRVRDDRVFGYTCLRELVNPANDHYAEDQQNYYDVWNHLCRDGKVPTLDAYRNTSYFQQTKWYHHVDKQPNKIRVKENTDWSVGPAEQYVD